jgi:SAM-dependent methyltransferase
VPHAAASFDVIMVLAVLTCIPDDQAQDALVAELDRVLAPGGLIYVSDLVLQPDERNRQRYAAYVRSAREPYGTFMTEDGAVCRHHDPGHLRRLFARFDLIGERHVDTATMNGAGHQRYRCWYASSSQPRCWSSARSGHPDLDVRRTRPGWRSARSGRVPRRRTTALS